MIINSCFYLQFYHLDIRSPPTGRPPEPDWWVTIHRVTKSRTWLKQLSTHTDIRIRIRFRFSAQSELMLRINADTLRPYGLWLTRLLCPWDSPGKSTGVGCDALLQGIFLTWGWNPKHLLHWHVDSLPLTPPEKPHLGWRTSLYPNHKCKWGRKG